MEYAADTLGANRVDEIKYQDKNGDNCAVADAYRVALKDVQVHVEDPATHIRSTITTDIVVNVPTVDFLGTNADVSDYGLIANQGLYINGNAWINGNVYAGVHSDRKSMDEDFEEDSDKYSRGKTVGGSYSGVFGGINIKDGTAEFKGNYIISKGDINLSTKDQKNPRLKVYTPKLKPNTPVEGEGEEEEEEETEAWKEEANLANLWFNSLRTIKKAEIDPLTTPVPSPLTEEPTIDIKANVFALNDMTLNADNTSVVIKGNYYGYNEGGLAEMLGKKTNREDSENSAIIVNGSNVYLDMSNINNFVLMGKAYIDFTHLSSFSS